jgi:polyisoprenoid-binding protein YceI
MKKMNITKLFIAMIGLSLMFAQCKKDETTTTYSKLSGTISLSADVPADGAIVSLSTTPNAANVVAKTVSDETGAYSFMGLENGTYYLNATFEPSNNNNLKAAGSVILTGKEVELALAGDLIKDITMEGMVSGGTTNFSLADWVLDITHSTIGFEFPYDAENAVFSGHFSRAGFDALEFDETNPSATTIKAWVDVTSVETGAPSLPGGHGRDGIEGCIQGTFGLDLDPADTIDVYSASGNLITSWPNDTLVAYTGDLWGDGSTTSYESQSAIVGATGVATFEATEVLPYGTGYVAKGDFSFAGTTTEVSLYFSFIEGYSSATKEYVSFYGWFDFAAAADYGISSTHVGDSQVKVVVSAQFNKAL